MGLKFIDVKKHSLDQALSNQYFEKILDTSDEWIQTRTGIANRYFTQQKASDMAVACAQNLAYDRERLDLVLVASFTADLILPAMASKVHQELDLKPACFTADLNIACTGFVGALIMAEKYLNYGQQAMILATEKISTALDLADRTTAVLFGDGCAGVVVEKNHKLWASHVRTYGNDQALKMEAGGSLTMEGKEVYRFAVARVSQSIQELLTQMELEAAGLAYVFSHQANRRILEKIARKVKLDQDQFPSNIHQHGNTSAASVPILLAENLGLLSAGQRIIFTAFGAGLTVSSILMEW